MRLASAGTYTGAFNRQVLGRLSGLAFLGFFTVYTAAAMTWLLAGLAPVLVATFPAVRDALLRWATDLQPVAPALSDLAWRIASASYGPQTGPLAETWPQPSTFLVVLEYLFSAINLVLGVLLVRLRSQDWVARLLALGMVGTAAVFNIQAHHAYDVVPALIGYAHDNFHLVAGVAYVAGLSLFPDGHLPHWPVPRWIRWLLRIPYLVVLGYVGLFGTLFLHGENPLQFILFFGVLIPIAGLTSQAFRYRRASTVEERQQSKLMSALALAFGASLLIGLLAIASRVFGPGMWPEQSGSLMQILISLVFPLMFTTIPVTLFVVMVRYKLWEMDRVINRTLVFGALTGGVVGLYVLLVGAANLLLFGTRGNWVASILAAGIVAVLFHPLRARLQRGVNRLMYGERDEPYAVISRLGQRLEGTLAPDAVLPTVVQTVRDALKVPYAAVELRHDGGYEIAAAAGTRVARVLCLPLSYHGDTVGRFIVGHRTGEDEFTPADRRLLDDLARQAGAAAHAVRLTADLQRSRERLVTAREEERRRLRRDLHDGIGPQLASQAITLDVASKLLRSDPETAATLLNDLKAQSQAAVGDIRRLVYDLRPPALDDLGLVSALREQAVRCGQAGLTIDVDAPEDLPPLPAAVEVAAYRIAQEALTNVLRHADARNCAIRLSLDRQEGVLCVEVEDDGTGISPNARGGVGLTSMRERATELGGSFLIEPLPGRGTLVRALLPLRKDEPWTASES